MIKRDDYMKFLKKLKKEECPPISQLNKAELKKLAVSKGFLQNRFGIESKRKPAVNKVKVEPKAKVAPKEPVIDKKALFKELRELGEKISKATTTTEATKYKRRSDAIRKQLLKK